MDARTRLWDVETGRLIQQISVLTGEVRVAAFSPDGSHIFIGSSDHAAHLYDATDFRVNTDVFEHDDAVWGVAFAPDGNTIVTGSNDGLRVWDVASLRLLNRTHGESAGIAYHKSGATIVAAHRSNNYTQLWEVPALKPVGPRMHHGGWVGLVSFKPDGTQVLTASFDQNARLWDALTGKLIKKLPHQDRVTAVAFSPDGKTFLTGAADKSAQLWDAETYQSIGVPLPHQGLVLDAEFSRDGAFFATASSDGAVWLWNANTRRPVYGALQHDVRVRSLSIQPRRRVHCDRVRRWHRPILGLGHWQAHRSPSPTQRSGS